MHDWNDENCLKILNNCERALPEKGKVLIFDFVVPPNGRIPHMFDMVMMAHSDGGIEKNRRTMEEAAYNCWFLNHQLYCTIAGTMAN